MKRILFFGSIATLFIWMVACNRTTEMTAEADAYSGATAKSSSNARATSNSDWWPNQLNLSLLRQHSSKSNPMADDFNYIESFNSLDYNALKADI